MTSSPARPAHPSSSRPSSPTPSPSACPSVLLTIKAHIPLLSSSPAPPSSIPEQPTSPSHHHPPSLPPSSSLERYWPFIAVTICSLYLITVLPFMAPGMFLLQFSLLRYIRHQHEKHGRVKGQREEGEEGRRRRRAKERERLARRRSSLKPPVMERIVEEEAGEAAEEEVGAKARSPKAAADVPLRPHRPPPLIIPQFNLGVITAPLPVISAASSSTPAPLSPPPSSFPLASPSRSWPADSLDLNDSLQSLLQSSIRSLERSTSQGQGGMLAATAALFAPSIFQSLMSPPTAPSSPTRFPSSPSSSSSSLSSPRCPASLPGIRGAARKSAFTFTRELPLLPPLDSGNAPTDEAVARVEGETAEVEAWPHALNAVVCVV